MKNFSRKHVVELMTAAAVLVGAISAWMHLFVSNVGWSVLFLDVGALCGIFFASHVDRIFRKIYSFSQGGHTTMIIMESLKIAVALFIPFVYAAFFGAMAGSAFQYYIHHGEQK
jgi:hypothetical protein